MTNEFSAILGEQEEKKRKKNVTTDGKNIIPSKDEIQNIKGTTFNPKQNQQIVTPQENYQQKENLEFSAERVNEFEALANAQEKTAEDTMSAWEMVGEAITGRKRSTKESILLPEVLDPGALKIEGGIGPNLKVAVGLLLSHNTKSQIETIKSAAPETKFRLDQKGNVIGNYKGQEFVLNKPGFSLADAQRTIVDMAAFFPAAKFTEIGAGLLAGIGFGGGLLTKAGLAAAGTYGTEKALNLLREEPENAPESAALAAAAEIPFPVAGAIIRRSKPFVEKFAAKLGAKELSRRIAKTGVVIDEDVLKSLQEAERASKESGIDFLPTQATGIKADDILQRVLTEQPASSKTIMNFLEKQDEQSRNAVYNFLNKIAPSSSLVEGPAKFKKSAIEAIDKLKRSRRSETEILYNNVLKDPPDVAVNDVISFINNEAKDFSKGGAVRSALDKAKKIISGGEKSKKIYLSGGNIKTVYKDVSLRKLHNAQMELRDMIDGVGDKAISSTAKKKLVEIRQRLLDAMENVNTGGSPAYQEVRNKFRELSQPIEELQNSLIGRASQLKDVDLRRMSNIIFNPAESNIETVKNVRKVIDDIDPEAFPMLLRSNIEQKIESIGKRAKNSPNEFSVALFRNNKQKKMFLEVMNPEQRKNAVWLEKALDVAAIGRGLGSDTASKTQIINKLSGTIAAPIIGIIAPATTLGSVGAALSGARLLSSALRQKTLDRRARVLAEIIVNEKWSQDMARIRKLGLETPNAMRQFAQLLNNIDLDLDKKETKDLEEQGIFSAPPNVQEIINNYNR